MLEPAPSLDSWAKTEVLFELVLIAHGLRDAIGEEAFARRLAELTPGQRAQVEHVLEGLAG